MRILIVTPVIGRTWNGNRLTTDTWAGYLNELGHDVHIADSYRGEEADALIALNASKGSAAVAGFRTAHPGGPIIVALSGTDIYPEPDDATLASMRLADRIVGLQPLVRQRVPAEYRDKLRIIIQAAEAPPAAPRSDEFFDICVVGRVRPVKDPRRAALAARLLPATSKIRIRHAGAILDPKDRAWFEAEQDENPRYSWLGELAPGAALQLVAQCRLHVVSSYFEGGGRVIGESVVAGTPVLGARNDASRSLLGEDYPGLYDAGDTQQLADLMLRAETDHAFFDTLVERTKARAPLFEPRREREAWRTLLEELHAHQGRPTA